MIRWIALLLALVLGGCGIQRQWLVDNECVYTGQMRRESYVSWAVIDSQGSVAPITGEVRLYEYLCSDRDETHWLQLAPG